MCFEGSYKCMPFVVCGLNNRRLMAVVTMIDDGGCNPFAVCGIKFAHSRIAIGEFFESATVFRDFHKHTTLRIKPIG